MWEENIAGDYDMDNALHFLIINFSLLLLLLDASR